MLLCLENSKWKDTIFRNHDFIEFRTKYIDLGEEQEDYFFTNYAANFAVDRNRITARKKEYYQKIISFLDNIAPIEGHYLERLWNVIFSKTS